MIFKRIRDLREDADLSQPQMGKHLNISQRAYSYYENGKRAIPAEILIQIAKFHNVSVDYILELSDIKNPYENH